MITLRNPTTSRLGTLGCRTRVLVLASIGLPVFAAIHFLAYWLRFDGGLTSDEFRNAAITLVVAVATKTVVFLSFRIYQSWNRYVSLHDLVVLGKATTVSSLLLAVIDYLFLSGFSVPRSIFLMDWGITILVVGCLRCAVRLIKEHVHVGRWLTQHAPVFIVGVNDAGEALLRAIRRNPKLAYNVVGFISEDGARPAGSISGVPIVGDLSQICHLATQRDVAEVLIAAGELSGQQVRELIGTVRDCGVSVKVLPSYEQLLSGNIDLRPREVSIEDLLRRDPVELDMFELQKWLDGRVLLVTGSAGSIGSEICRQLLHFSPSKLVLVDQSETGQFFLERELREGNPDTKLEVCVADVADRLRMTQIFRDHKPDIVFHAAAYKHVPLMEANPGEAIKNITLTSRLLADLAHQHHVQSFVMVSTDKAVNPTSVMGVCKRVAELYVQALAAKSRCRFVTVRFGNVLDSAGSVIPIFREQIAKGGPVTVTHPDMTRFFMTIPEASQLVIQAGAMGNGGEIFVLDMGDPVRIADLAEDMIRLSGLRVGEDVELEFIGIRPGEKLYEELHADGELHAATSHQKIRIAQCSTPSLPEIRAAIERLMACVESGHPTIAEELRRIVPTYQNGSPDQQATKRAAA
ncbi:MAG: nucleoside-diphosphate sugar epimerase/dehydratase [Planctomycetota bacterium]|nr:nucleoside-diphosphate sugar epimerase/dehydratase [Planctomycetota bacterium]